MKLFIQTFCERSDYIETCDFLSENVPIINDVRAKPRFSCR